ncbi:MAG: SDR family oxidoreductase [Candidatus Thermoplasmatota archaeon]|nr:SDR family oxidoreductase [Candidatus Thermoplasmatota archaeon]
MNFKDKVVLISGATGGMGEELAKLLSNEGCKLALFARREKKLEEISKSVSNGKTECIYRKCDVKNSEDIKEAVELTYKKFGRIDVAVLTAGILSPSPIEIFDSKIIKNSMDVNFMGNVYFIEYLLPIMKAQRSGTIAVTSTLPDKRGVPGWGSYGASKAAVSWLIESLRAEAKQKYNVNFITIKPGSVETPMIEDYHRQGAIQPEKAAKIIVKGIQRKKKIIQFPLGQVLLIRTSDMFPATAYDMLPVDAQKGDGYPVVDEK